MKTITIPVELFEEVICILEASQFEYDENGESYNNDENILVWEQMNLLQEKANEN